MLRTALLTLSMTACVSTTYEVHRAGLVPAPAPPIWSGSTGRLGVTVGNSSVLWESAPERAARSESGLYVARHNAELQLRLPVRDWLEFWVPIGFSPSAGEFASAPTLIDGPDGDVWRGGLGIAFERSIAEELGLSAAFEGLLTGVPSHVVAVCVEQSEGDRSTPCQQVIDKEDTSLVIGGRATVLLSWTPDPRFRLFGGVALKNHESNLEDTVERHFYASTPDGRVRPGPIYAMPGIGAAYSPAPWVSLLAQAYVPFAMGSAEIIYGPVFGLAVELRRETSGYGSAPEAPEPEWRRRGEKEWRD